MTSNDAPTENIQDTEETEEEMLDLQELLKNAFTGGAVYVPSIYASSLTPNACILD